MLHKVSFFQPLSNLWCFVFWVFWVIWTPDLESNCQNGVQHLFKAPTTSATIHSPPNVSSQKIKTHFKMAPPKEQQRILNEFHRQMAQEGGIRAHLQAHQLQRVSGQHLAVNLNHDLPQYTEHLRQWGSQRISELVYLTSGAGLWSRGGEVVKALVPYNLTFFCSDHVIDHLRLASKILGADHHQVVIKLSGYKLGPRENLTAVSADLVSRQKKYLQHLVRNMVYLPTAINPIDVKLINVAIYSVMNKTYIPFDVWTSQTTNRPIQEYLAWLKNYFGQKIFHPKTQINQQIHTILAKYFKMTSTYNDSNIFAYQESFQRIRRINGIFQLRLLSFTRVLRKKMATFAE